MKLIFENSLFNYSENDFKLPENVKTENDPWYLSPPFSQLLLGQISKVRSVLKSACYEDSKTGLTFEFWPSRS